MTNANQSWNEKRYNEIALKWLAGVEPDSTAAADLRTIAQTCLPDGGRSVLDARGLCAVWLKEYYDEDNCSSLQLRNGDGAASVNAISPVLSIVPNPADDIIRVSLNVPLAEGANLLVQFFNLNGQKMHTASMTFENGEFTVSVNGWPGGLYIARVVAGTEMLSKTFAVQHR